MSLDPTLERAEQLQAAGDLAAASEAYRRVPDLADLLACVDADGRPVRGPSFIFIGPPRTSTTWLAKHLSRHPELYIPTGEQEYFSNPTRSTPRDYVRLFADAGVFKGKDKQNHDGRRLFGDKSPAALTMSNDQIALCAALFPKLRIICGVRDPARRAWSHIQLKKYRPEDYTVVDGFTPKRLKKVLEFGHYAPHLARWGRHFPPEQILLVDFARQTWRPRAVYDEVLRHIGAHPFPRNDLGEQNPDKKMGSPQVLDELAAFYEGERWDIPYLNWVIRDAWAEAHGSKRPRAPLALPNLWVAIQGLTRQRRLAYKRRRRRRQEQTQRLAAVQD